MKSQSRHSLGRLNSVLLVLLLLTVLATFRLYGLFQYSFEPDSYTGMQAYRLDHLIATGHSLPSERGEVLLDKLEATKLVVAELSPEMDLLTTSLAQSATFMLVILAILRCYRRRTRPFLFGVGFLAMAFSLSAGPGIILQLAGWNGPYAWIFLMLSVYFGYVKTPTSVNSALALFFILLLPLTYFTIALLFLEIAAVALVYQSIARREVFQRKLLISFSVFFVSWMMYVSVTSFGTVLGIGEMLRGALAEESRINDLRFVVESSTPSIVANLASYSLVYVPLVYVVLDRKKMGPKVISLFIILLIAFIPLSIGLYLWMGTTGLIQRVPYIVALASVLFFAIYSGIQLPGKRDMRKTALLAVTVVLAIVLSNYTHVNSGYAASKITVAEAAGSEWLLQVSQNKSVTFTDLRLAGPFIAMGHSTLIINDATIAPDRVNYLLNSIFYGNGDPTEALRSLTTDDGMTADFLFFSDRYSQNPPSIKGNDYYFQSAPPGFLDRYYQIGDFNLVYSNGEIAVMSVIP